MSTKNRRRLTLGAFSITVYLLAYLGGFLHGTINARTHDDMRPDYTEPRTPWDTDIETLETSLEERGE